MQGNQNRQEKKNAAHTHNANADVGRLNHTLHYLFHHSPWFFPCFRRFFSKLLLSFNGFLFSFSLIVFFCLGFLRPFNYFCHVRFRCFLFVFLVTPFGVRVCYVGYIGWLGCCWKWSCTWAWWWLRGRKIFVYEAMEITRQDDTPIKPYQAVIV